MWGVCKVSSWSGRHERDRETRRQREGERTREQRERERESSHVLASFLALFSPWCSAHLSWQKLCEMFAVFQGLIHSHPSVYS